MPIPEQFKLVQGADPEAFTRAVGQQLDLAQREYDPNGTFVQRREASWMVYAAQDTRGIKSMPTIYQSENTNITVQASTDEEGAIRVALGVRAHPDDTLDIYSNDVEEELPVIVALLGKIANVELAELESHPRRAIRALGESAGASVALERFIAQKTLALPDTLGGAMNVTYFNMTGTIGMCEARFARQVQLPEGKFLYQQNISRDNRDLAVYCWPRAFRLTRDMPMDEAYFGAELYGEELTDRPVPGEIRMTDFETRLRLAGNTLIGVIEAADVDRIVSEPINSQYQLHA